MGSTLRFAAGLLIVAQAVLQLAGCGGGGGVGDPPAPATHPGVSLMSPGDRATGISVADPILVSFTKAMDGRTIDESTFTLKDEAGLPVPGSVTYNDMTRVATFRPRSILDFSVTYTASVAAGVRDTGGNTMTSNASWTFTTGGEGSGLWNSVSVAGAPLARYAHTAVWTGAEMIVWGGYGYGEYLNTGGRYDPGTDAWLPVSTSGAPVGRAGHVAVWTGTEMVVWGGFDGTGYLGTGGRYDPRTDSWRPLPAAGAPTARTRPSAVWTGSEMIVWGGYGIGPSAGPEYLDTGGRYDPGADGWRGVSQGFDAPSARCLHEAVWTGAEMIVWGGYDGARYLDTGSRYDPSADVWSAMTLDGAPSPRMSHRSVWAGAGMVVWGGNDEYAFLRTGGRYDPATGTWSATSDLNAPRERTSHTAVWTGSLVILWGGKPDNFSGISSGGRYDPSLDSWSETRTGADVPQGRADHTAVWTGAEMIVWGGRGIGGLMNTGGRYTP